MKKTQSNLYLLYMMFGVFLVTANAIASKIFNTGVSLMGAPVTLTVGAICYPFTFLITDVIGEIWGKKESQRAVVYGFICQVVAILFVVAARYFPPVDPEMQDAYVKLLGQSWVFVIASLGAFIVSQSWDVFIFHKIRDKYIEKHGSTKGGKWIWNNASTMTSQLIDSALFVIIAFGLGFKWLFDPTMHKTMVAMIVGQYLIKFIIAAADTPIFYLLTRERKSNKSEEVLNEITN